MEGLKKIHSALISVYHKDGLDDLVHFLGRNGVTLISTGGTREFIEKLGYTVVRVEDVTQYPSILDGRVKTLHPKIFGGILARREEKHLEETKAFDIPLIDLVIVDLYPFEETLKSTDSEAEIIEKIDIGGISLIRAAAKNYNDTAVVASRKGYQELLQWLNSQQGALTLAQRKFLAKEAFAVSSHYDTAIYSYFAGDLNDYFKSSIMDSKPLRYGENPHQGAYFYGNLEDQFTFYGGKELSYNNLVDVDASLSLIQEFINDDPTFCIIKHTNACGVATRQSIYDAYVSALACDPVSAFGGILVANSEIDGQTAAEISKLFYEVLLAPSYTDEALNILTSQPKRIIIKCNHWSVQKQAFKSLLNGVIYQDADLHMEYLSEFNFVTEKTPDKHQADDLVFALKCAKHLKSNTIVLVKDRQMIGMGCGQTSRIDACAQAIQKAKGFGFDLKEAVMASDAFFPFPDCVELAYQSGINAVVQPGGSIKDQLSIDFCNANGIAMVFTGYRHFKH